MVALCDVDGFRAINEGHGQAIGDAVLGEVAARLRQRVRRSDLLARIGGDQFVVALNRPGGGQAPGGWAQTFTAVVARSMERPVVTALGPVEVALSVGHRDPPRRGRRHLRAGGRRRGGDAARPGSGPPQRGEGARRQVVRWATTASMRRCRVAGALAPSTAAWAARRLGLRRSKRTGQPRTGQGHGEVVGDRDPARLAVDRESHLDRVAAGDP